MPSAEAKELLYTLNPANLDSYSNIHPHIRLMESNAVEFCRRQDRYKRPYRTEIQLYKALFALRKVLVV